MAVIVVGGNGRGVGKTTLLCGLIAALPGYRWTAVKISSHPHRLEEPEFRARTASREVIWEETRPGQGSDTARYLAAGAERALLLTAPREGFAALLDRLWKSFEPGAHLLFESNRILEHLEPDLCLMIQPGPDRDRTPAVLKPSFVRAMPHADALVARAEADRRVALAGTQKPLFELADFGRISAEMLAWLAIKLGPARQARLDGS